MIVQLPTPYERFLAKARRDGQASRLTSAGSLVVFVVGDGYHAVLNGWSIEMAAASRLLGGGE